MCKLVTYTIMNMSPAQTVPVLGVVDEAHLPTKKGSTDSHPREEVLVDRRIKEKRERNESMVDPSSF